MIHIYLKGHHCLEGGRVCELSGQCVSTVGLLPMNLRVPRAETEVQGVTCSGSKSSTVLAAVLQQASASAMFAAVAIVDITLAFFDSGPSCRVTSEIASTRGLPSPS